MPTEKTAVVAGRERARERLFWAVLALQTLGFSLRQLAHLGGFQWGSDEGIYLMRVRLMQVGYRLYADIWTDQLPGLVLLVRGAFAVLGSSPAVGRGVVVVLSALGLFSSAALARQVSGRAGALAVVPLLGLAPNVYWLSRAIVSPDLPATCLGAAGLAAMGRYLSTRRRLWQWISGLAFAAGLYVKATAVLPLAAAGVWLLVVLWRDVGLRPGALLRRAWPWVASLVVPLAVGLAPFDLPSLWRQFIVTQVASGQMELKILPHAAKMLRYLGGENLGLAFLGGVGAIVSLRRHRSALLVGGV